MILEKTPITLAEVGEIVKNQENKDSLKDYLKKFNKLSKEKAVKLADEIKKLDNMRLREENIVKIVDFVPKEAEELNKLFNDLSFSEEEVNSILDLTRKY